MFYRVSSGFITFHILFFNGVVWEVNGFSAFSDFWWIFGFRVPGGMGSRVGA